jgi:hypothetical protein
MEFIDKVKRLKETTKSPEVRSLCEGFLSGASTQGDLLENIGFVSEVSSLSKTLTERTDIYSEMREKEVIASKKLSETLMESWKPASGSQNSGTWQNAEAKNNSSESALNESLSALSNDKVTNSFLKSESIKNLGVLEAVNTLRNSAICEHHQVKILLENYRNLLTDKGVQEFFILEKFIADLENLKWDNSVKSISESLKKTHANFEREIEVSKVIYSLKNSGSREFYSELYESLNEWMLSEEKSNGLLVNQISRFKFNPVVKNLIGFLNINESKRDSRKLILPDVAQGESKVEKIFSPFAKNGDSFAFSMGGNIFEGNSEKVYKISESKAKEKFGEDFINLVSILQDPNVRVNESGVHFFFGKKRISVTEGINESASVFLDRTELKFRNSHDLAKLVGLEVSSYHGYNDFKTVSQVISVYENFNSIAEMDFAKSIVSKIYEGLCINLFKWNDKLYLQKINTAMLENSVYSVNSLQAVKMIRESLRYDISEGLSEFLQGDLKVKSILINDRSEILGNIQKIEEQISKVQNVLNDPKFSKNESLIEAEKLLKRELKVLRNKWTSVNEELEAIENKSFEGSDDNLSEDQKFHIGDYVRIKESGDTGKIISIDGTSGRYTILKDDGNTEDHLFDSIQDIEEAINKAGEENAEASSDFDYQDSEENQEEESEDESSSEEIKESSNGMSKAPVNSKKSKVKPQQPTYSKAPGKNSSKPMAKDLKNAKAANLSAGVKGQKPTDFDVSGYEIGYNLDESTSGDVRSSKLVNAPSKTGKTPETKGSSVKDQGMSNPIARTKTTHSSKTISAISKAQNLADSPGNRKTGLKFGITDFIGYNLNEAGTEKKN